jgi:hypothetical protein
VVDVSVVVVVDVDVSVVGVVVVDVSVVKVVVVDVSVVDVVVVPVSVNESVLPGVGTTARNKTINSIIPNRYDDFELFILLCSHLIPTAFS